MRYKLELAVYMRFERYKLELAVYISIDRARIYTLCTESTSMLREFVTHSSVKTVFGLRGQGLAY